MDIVKMTRELGAAIQQDERYIRFAAVRAENEADAELQTLMGEMQLRQMNYQREASSEEPDNDKMHKLELEFNDLYTKFMENEKMQKYEAARAEIDEMMNYLMGILGLCVNGADPATCEPEKYDCGCSCDECSSDCHHH